MAEPLGKEYAIKDKVAQLQQLLLANHPQMPTLLQQIHKITKDDEELTHYLSEEEIGVIVSGLKQHSNIVIATNVLGSKSSKSMKNITLDDL